jgi:DNA-binding MarR family transcriptional regulator
MKTRPPGARRIGEELHRNLRGKGHEALLAMLRTADVAKQLFSEIFEREGATFQQYNVLRILLDAGDQGLPTLEIGERMIERTPGVTRIVDRLEGKGWVARRRCTEDRRKVWCRITREGRDLLDRLDAPVAEADDGLFRSLQPDEIDRLIDSLDTLRARITASSSSS